eukprot:CAMPEP_0116134620 /NCGR_PEP_ID=MMETSP0329-20121206/10749_1 /TAXON_ID=697910 /ORGANISM="Pseudo-nitzschia arenysensis, Strain B593" /LENGTH=624 /DNA_ID=CAMNT_0003629355 /DNA_START=756 /DNA_END=2630 /DNA_ORIENTATION=+
MADSQQPQSAAPNDASGVGNSVVNDLMRVYENLTQSSTPQGVPDASKALSLAYSNAAAPQTSTLPVYQPPPGYPLPPNVYQQHQPEATAKNALHVKPEQTAPTMTYNGGPPSMTAYPPPQPQAPPGYAPVPLVAASAVPGADAKDGTARHIQRSGEDPHAILRTSSIASKSSQVSAQNHHQPPADASSESDKSVGGRSRRKRKQVQEVGPPPAGAGKKSGRGKKAKKEDGRWSKRFTWPEDLHRDFVSAIFDVGLKHSSPSTIMEHMPKHEQINTERIKSHLQKYRLHRVKSKKEFISSYEASLRNFQQNQNGSSSNLVSGAGEVAAHLTATTIGVKSNTGAKEGPASNALAAVASAEANQKQIHSSQNGGGDNNESLMLPQLSEAEKASPIGAAMGYLMGLFFSLKQQLIIQRSLEAAGEKAKRNVVFSSSTPAIAPSGGNAIVANNPSAAATAAAVAAGVDFVADGNLQQSQPQNGVRSNIEVNSMMKREMKNQMALQNKMRALKQQELDKYKHINKGATPDAMMTTMGHDGANQHLPVAMEGNAEGGFASGAGTSEQPTQHQPLQHMATQGAGEMAGNDMSSGNTGAREGGNGNLLGIENSEEFWHTDVMDDQLFEFLLNS